MTDNKQDEAARKRLGEERARREKQRASQRDAMAGVKPTPTQEENDLAASGVPVTPEPDGSPQQPPAPPEPPPPEGGATRTRQVEAGSKGAYSTRSATASE
ncbi:hypothetical protein [Bradyrhizobium sp. 170]|uniref:hypothetical protein n=1 Tax=Bradyrhizobium sp. 170 TaxID=2782641 RepID=UPI001FFF5389|nr:hypothetical protein [Bradyrhizobium sp. 170]UPK03112.1 hypothetical protein IVB05_37140 [Bradyrhizobium sp. 170]